MKIGVVTSSLNGRSFEAALAFLRAHGFDCLELACAGWFHDDLTFGDPAQLAKDSSARERWCELVAAHGLTVSALAAHGQPLAPDPAIRAAYKEQFTAACAFAEAIGVSRVTVLCGLPEGAEGDAAPCWVTSAYPPINQDIVAWQWERRVVPTWRELGEIATAHGVTIGVEMHPGDVVYNPRTMRRLHDEVGPVIGCNFDPSHLFWQGIDPIAALHDLQDLVVHVHAKDTSVDRRRRAVDGVLDTVWFDRFGERTWNFRAVGDGHDEHFWREFVSALREIGYDDALSIEHEDEYLPVDEGIVRGVKMLRRVVLPAPAGVNPAQEAMRAAG